MAKIKKIGTDQKVITTLICLVPLFSNYGFGLFLLPEIPLMVALMYGVLSSKRYHWSKAVILFGGFLLFSAFMGFVAPKLNSAFDVGQFFSTFARLTFYFLCIVFLSARFFNLTTAIKVCSSVSVVNSVYLIIQSIAYNFFNRLLPWYFSFLPIKQNSKLIEDPEYYISNFGYRPSGLFFEPEQFALYVVPTILFVLFFSSREYTPKLKPLSISLMCIAVVLSGSGTGLGLLAYIIVMYILKSVKTYGRKTAFQKIMPAVVIIGCVVGAVLFSSYLLDSLDRLTNTDEMSSFAVRVLRGITAYKQYPFINKLFGVGYGNYDIFNAANGISTVYDFGESLYVNAFMFMTTGTGVFGALLYLAANYALIKKSHGVFRYRAIMFFVALFLTTEALTMSIIMIYGFILSSNKYYERERL